MNTNIAAGIDYYKKERSSVDIDLIQEVRNCMMASGLGQRISEAYNQNRFIQEAEGKTPDVQRFLLNRFWSQQLMLSSKQSIEERYCLIPDGTIDEWLTLFKQKVLPFVIENQLPVNM